MLLATAVLAGKSKGGSELLSPAATLVLPLSEDELNGCDRKRYQWRQIRSVGAGSFTVRYQTGRRNGERVGPCALHAVVAPRSPFAYDVVEAVVRLRYVELKQREEIRAELAARRVRWNCPPELGTLLH